MAQGGANENGLLSRSSSSTKGIVRSISIGARNSPSPNLLNAMSVSDGDIGIGSAVISMCRGDPLSNCNTFRGFHALSWPQAQVEVFWEQIQRSNPVIYGKHFLSGVEKARHVSFEAVFDGHSQLR